MLLIPGPAWGLGGTGEPGAPITHLPLRSPGGKGVCWSWRRRAVGLRRSHFSHQKQLRFPGPPSCPLPGAVSPQEQQRGQGWAPRAPSWQRGAGWQSRVPSAVFMQTLQNLLANEVGTCVPWDFLAWIWPASPVRDQRTPEGGQELQRQPFFSSSCPTSRSSEGEIEAVRY